MTLDVIGDLNWLAVVVAAVAYFALGALWYAEPVFGKAWMRALDWQPPPDYKPGPMLYVVPAITCLISAIAIATIAAASATDTLVEGVVLGLVAGIGLACAAVFVVAFFDPKKSHAMTYAAITGGYHVVGLLIASIIVAAWQ